MSNETLLAELQKAKLLSEAAVNKLKRDALLSGQSVEALIAGQRLLDDRKVAELKSVVLGVPYKKIDPKDVDKAVFDFIPEETARTYAAVPIFKKDNLLIIGMVNPDDAKAQDALKFIGRR